ncbi:MAG TPA: hypothetical protein VLT45_19455 [Kofleriaceae bacterium]|nr:hypothetical protein [Kofleriaceae bacterium]
MAHKSHRKHLKHVHAHEHPEQGHAESDMETHSLREMAGEVVHRAVETVKAAPHAIVERVMRKPREIVEKLTGTYAKPSK